MNKNKQPKILFISRAYPPILGGIENQNYGIAHALAKITETKIIANKKGKKNLPFFLPILILKGLFILPKYDVILVGDGVLTPIARLFKFIYPKKKYLSIIHGLDITFAYKKSLMGKIYNKINIPSHKKMDKLIMVGRETIRQALKVGIPEEKCVFIPNALDPENVVKTQTRADLEKLIKMDLAGKKVITRTGRYVKHKGLEWFIRNIMPNLPENYILVAAGGVPAKATAGDENMFPACQESVKEFNLENRVRLLKNISWSDMQILFNTADLSITPNIEVPGSMEGFGITSIEAAVCGTAVVASNLQGIPDAIHDEKNGFLVEPENARAWTEKIKELLENDGFRKEFGQKAREYTLDHFTWEGISQKYLEEINKLF